MRLRQLEPGEEPRLLDLLDGWPFRDGRRGRDFFRRYLDADPAYSPSNVWVAEDDGELVSCVQVFPRTIRSARGEIACGGIGSVFTQPARRRTGVASELLERAVSAMATRGVEVSLLVASRLRWYSDLGWRAIAGEEIVMRPGSRRTTARSAVGRPLRGESELERVAEIATGYSRGRLGSVVRDREAWRASLLLAGDPEEEFLVVGPGDGIDAYLRLARLDGAWRALEWGCVAGCHELLADLLLARGGRAVVVPPLRDEALEAGLVDRGARFESRAAGGSWMLRAVTLSEEDAATALPPDRFAFWPADRF